jgi:pimeloyl-ACP methyl ester carboxylesterase
VSSAIREKVVMLGPAKSLVSIVSEPATEPAASSHPVIVLLNAGIIHHVGPNRLYVLLSRALAALGHTVVRFDLSGVGDSAAREDGLAPLDAALADIRDALDSLAASRPGCRFLLVGLCSGANHAVAYAGSDPRVSGIVLLDPFIPHTLRYHAYYYMRRLLHLPGWRNFLKGGHPLWWRLVRAIRGGPAVAANGAPGGIDLQSREVRDSLRERYSACVRQGVRLLVVLTDGRQDCHNHLGQFRAALSGVPFGDALTSSYFHGCDHTFSTEAKRAKLFQLVQEWIAVQPR